MACASARAPEGSDLLKVELGLQARLVELRLQRRRLGHLHLERRLQLCRPGAERAGGAAGLQHRHLLERLLARLELVELEQLRREVRLHPRTLLLPERLRHLRHHRELAAIGHHREREWRGRFGREEGGLRREGKGDHCQGEHCRRVLAPPRVRAEIAT